MLTYLARKNHAELANLSYQQEKLYRNGAVKLLASEIKQLTYLDNTIQSMFLQHNDEIDEFFIWEELTNLRNQLLSDDSILKEYPIQEIQLPEGRLLKLLNLERDVIELCQNKMWENFLSHLDEQVVVFALPESGPKVNLSKSWYIGVAKSSEMLPNFRFKGKEIIKGGQSLADGVLTKITPPEANENQLEVLIPRIGLTGGYFIKKVSLNPNGIEMSD